MTKEYTVSTTCPACGHVDQKRYHEKEMQDTFGNRKDVEVLCTRCQANFEQPMELACAEWDDYCQEIPLPADV